MRAAFLIGFDYTYYIVLRLLTWVLISAAGTRFPRAAREPPRRFASAGSPVSRCSRRSRAPSATISTILIRNLGNQSPDG